MLWTVEDFCRQELFNFSKIERKKKYLLWRELQTTVLVRGLILQFSARTEEGLLAAERCLKCSPHLRKPQLQTRA